MKNDNVPSLFTKLYWLSQLEKIDPDVFLYFSELFWPKFIKRHEFVFLKEGFTEERYKNIILQGDENSEFWMNLFLVSDYFEEIESSKNESIQLAKTLIQSWAAKLKTDFPDLNFIVQFLCNEDEGEYGLTFYQSKNRPYESEEIPFPNIKESCLEGLKPGKPTIRQPRPDETPHN